MTNRNETTVWNKNSTFISNQPANPTPALQTLKVVGNSLENGAARKGQGVYIYDFGATGTIGTLDWNGDGFVSFRYKVADTTTVLNQINYVGSSQDRFSGSVVSSVNWNQFPGPYVIVQNNQLNINGATPSTNIFEDVGEVRSATTTEFPAAFAVKMRLQSVPNTSGAEVYLGITDGINTLLVKKFYEQINAPAIKKIVNGQTTWLPNDTNVGNTASVVVTRNGTLIFTDDDASDLTDGILENISYAPIPTNKIDTLINLKRYGDVTALSDVPMPYGIVSEAIPFKIRSDYNPTQTPTGFQQYLYYDVEQDSGFYRATVPMVHRKIDLYESQISSWNWDPNNKVYNLADGNNIWKLAITLSPGTYRYNFLSNGQEYIDITNPLTYYLDKNNQPQLLFGSYGYGYGYNGQIPTGVITYSELILDSTQTIEFIYQGPADQVYLIGTFNDYNPTSLPMIEQVDRQLIRRLSDPNFIYTNDNVDYHKVEILLPDCTNIDTIDFVTLIPLGYKQRVKMFLDDLPVSKLDWNLIPVLDADDIIKQAGVGTLLPPCMVYGYGYGKLMSGYGSYYGYGYGTGSLISEGYSGIGGGTELVCPISPEATCDQIAAVATTFSYWDNNTDTICGAEDKVIRWCLKGGQKRTVSKITFLSRIESGPPLRQHVALYFYGTSAQGLTVSDYGFTSSYELRQRTGTTKSDAMSNWEFPIANLGDGINQLIPSTLDANGNAIYGTPVTVTVSQARPSVWTINNSAWASGSLEIVYGIAGKLAEIPVQVNSVVDEKSLNTNPIAIPTERFVDLNIIYQVSLINAQIDPKIPMWAKLQGLVNTFVIKFYFSEADAENDTNSAGFVTAAQYGTALPADFTGNADPQGRMGFFALSTITYQGNVTTITVGNLVAMFEKGGADTIFAVTQVR